MTLTPREIQEKQFHDAFRGYNHEEVDLFIDQVAEAYETIFKENQAFNRRLAELQEKLKSAPESPAAAAPPSPPAVRSESEDMLKRMLVTAQETADKAVANARAKAQMLVDEAEIKARRIEEQADSVSSTTLQDAQRRARDMIQTAQQEEAELRDRIEGMKSFERDFRMRLSAFIRSQLELLEAKPMVSPGSTSPVASPFFDRSKLLSETIEKFGDYGLPKAEIPSRQSQPERELAPASPPPPVEPAAEQPGPRTERSEPDWLSGMEQSADPVREPEVSDEPPSWSAEPEAVEPKPEPDSTPEGVSVGAVTASEDKDRSVKKSSSSDTKSIHELFWGED
ncbi:MAG TPA: DivIVA domain-containing protein [Actinomycetota bacterium]|nr:DivIVA domain-containing protein [Actinomycetota bacterium]